MMRKFLLAAILLLLAVQPLLARPFVFTAIPDEDETRLKQRFDQVAAYLQDKLGVEVQFVPVKNYAASIAAFANDQVQMAWFGGLSGLQARKLVPGSKAIAQGYEDQFFVSYFIVNTSTGLTESKDFPMGLKGLTFTFGSKDSTSGRLMPEYFVRKAFGKGPNEVFSRVGFSGDHTKTLELVQSGAYQAGALNYKVWENEVKAGHVDASKVRVIWRTPTYPDYNWSVRGDLDEHYGQGFTDKLTQALLGMTDRKLLDAFPRQSFVPASNADYQAVETVGKAIGLLD
jgi:phosphonate transport system substrate-binding protein